MPLYFAYYTASCLMLLVTYYAFNHAGIIGLGLARQLASWWVDIGSLSFFYETTQIRSSQLATYLLYDLISFNSTGLLFSQLVRQYFTVSWYMYCTESILQKLPSTFCLWQGFGMCGSYWNDNVLANYVCSYLCYKVSQISSQLANSYFESQVAKITPYIMYSLIAMCSQPQPKIQQRNLDAISIATTIFHADQPN